MLRVAICGRNLAELRKILAKFPVRLVERNPAVVLSYGGDGALLGSERLFPGVPKCPLRDRAANPKCPDHAEESILRRLLAGDLRETPLIKLRAQIRGERRLVAINDIVVHNRFTTSALRYRLWLDDDLYANRVVGDGLVVATPFGSTGYYRSITHSLFKLGIGLAFNNSMEPVDHLVIADDSQVRLEVLRGPAVVMADNENARLILNRGDQVAISKAATGTSVFGLETFRCPACYRLRQENPDAF